MQHDKKIGTSVHKLLKCRVITIVKRKNIPSVKEVKANFICFISNKRKIQ